MNHYVFHPRVDPPHAESWRETVVRGPLRIRLEWVSPRLPGPLPVVIVHPAAGQTASNQRGVLRDLASAGYVGVAADYQRAAGNGFKPSLFPWRDEQDERAVLDIVKACPRVDSQRVATMGFSQGGVFSLLIAAYTGEVRAVVAYYPVTDFVYWLSDTHRSRARRFGFWFVRRHFRSQSGAKTDAEYQKMLVRASALQQAERITCPVLLIHGDHDATASIQESQRLKERLEELGRDVELFVVSEAPHVFNFRDATMARLAWDHSIEWLQTRMPSGQAPLPAIRHTRVIPAPAAAVPTVRSKRAPGCRLPRLAGGPRWPARRPP